MSRPAENDVLLDTILAASPGTPTLTCRKIADAVRPLLAQAWDEGLAVGMDDDRCTNEENPYPLPPGPVCPDCDEPVTREQPCWIEPWTNQRHHDPCP